MKCMKNCKSSTKGEVLAVKLSDYIGNKVKSKKKSITNQVA